jgi:hypothetical protein
MLPIVKPGKLAFQLSAATPYQAKAFDADMRLSLNTADGSSRKDLLLELESMPVPVKFLPGHYSVDGVIIEDPMTWANLRGNKGHAAFDTVADIRTLAEMIQERKAARKN